MMQFERTFDNAALLYDRVRPEYPKQLYDDLFQYKPLTPESRVLEIGTGTGKATRPVLDRQCAYLGLEPGENLAALAWEKYRNEPHFSLLTQTLQAYACDSETYDLIYAATAFHWIEESYGYQRVYELLKPGGAFARFAYHALPDENRPALMDEIQTLYTRFYPRPQKPKPFDLKNAEALAQLAQKYGFINTQAHLYHQIKDFSADEYLMLLHTYPDHMAIEPDHRKKLFEGIHAAIIRHGGVLGVHYAVDLELAAKP